MARTKVQDNAIFNWTNTSGGTVTSGSPVRIGHMIGIALVTIANGAAGAVDCTPGSVWTVPKVSAAVFIAGEKLLWDASAAAFDDAAATGGSGDIMGAVCAFEPGGNGETTCKVVLTPGNTTLS
jgi:predicted RecA/RadA family phage recombinase